MDINLGGLLIYKVVSVLFQILRLHFIILVKNFMRAGDSGKAKWAIHDLPYVVPM